MSVFLFLIKKSHLPIRKMRLTLQSYDSYFFQLEEPDFCNNITGRKTQYRIAIARIIAVGLLLSNKGITSIGNDTSRVVIPLRILICKGFKKWLKRDLNLRPWAYESPALTTAPLSQIYFTIYYRSTVGRAMSSFQTTEFLITSSKSYEFW